AAPVIRTTGFSLCAFMHSSLHAMLRDSRTCRNHRTDLEHGPPSTRRRRTGAFAETFVADQRGDRGLRSDAVLALHGALPVRARPGLLQRRQAEIWRGRGFRHGAGTGRAVRALCRAGAGSRVARVRRSCGPVRTGRRQRRVRSRLPATTASTGRSAATLLAAGTECGLARAPARIAARVTFSGTVRAHRMAGSPVATSL